MNGWPPILRRARKSVSILAVTLVLCAAVVAGTQYWASKVNATLMQLQASVQAQKDQLSARQDDLHNMRDHIKRFEFLRTQGMVGSPDRAQWVEQLQSSYLALGFVGRLTYQLQAPQPLVDAAAQAAGTEAPGSSTQLHDLKFEIRQSHEDDVINLISSYRDAVKGRFRVQSCTLDGAKEEGLNANCVLRFVTVPLPPPAIATEVPPN